MADMGPRASRGTQKRTKLGRFLRFCVWSLAIVLAMVTVVNLTVAKLPSMPPADGKFISLRGIQIHYFEQPGTGPLVLMIHGLPGTLKDFDPVIPYLPGAHVISIDRPGFGWSKGGWTSYQDQIDLVHELLTQFKASPAILVGHSFGGTLALGVARRYPQDVAKMVLVAPGAGGMRADPMDNFNARYVRFSHLPVVRTIVDVTVGNILMRLLAGFGASHAFTPAPVDPRYQRRLLSVTLTPGNLDAYASDQLQLDETLSWVDQNVPEIRVPSTIIGATGDQLVGIQYVRRLAETLPSAELRTVDGNHVIPYTHPDVVAEAITQAVATSRP